MQAKESKATPPREIIIQVEPVSVRIDQAAESKGMTSLQWALSNLLAAADRDIHEAHIIRLNSKAWNDFTAALNEPMGLRLNELLERDPIWT